MRKSYIDNIRTLTIFLVVIYHVIYIFNSVVTDGVIGPITEAAKPLDTVQYLLYPWFMVILFILSGMCAKYYLENHTAKEFLRARTRKLLVPSTVGLFIFGWLQGYINMAVSHAFETMPQTIPAPVFYLILCVSGTGVLWTIQVMWILSVVLILLTKLEKGRLLQAGARVKLPVLLLAGVLVWGSAQLLNTPVVAVYRFGIYGFTFLLGYYVFSHEAVTDQLRKYAVPLLIAAVGLGIAYTVHDFGQNYAVAPSVNSPLAVAYGWVMCLAVIGCMKRWGDRSGNITVFLAKKSFGLYIFHYLTLSACAYYLTSKASLPAGAVYALTVTAAFLGAYVLYELIARIPVLRWCILGIKKEKKADR